MCPASWVRICCGTLLLFTAPLGAQVVRGVVRDSASGVPIPGVIVSLDEAVPQLDTDGSLRRASLVLAVLTNERGEYSLRAGFAGRFVLSAKRVGLRRFVSRPFALAAGQQYREDVTLSRIDFAATLPEISTLTDAPCASRPEEGRRVAAIWEEARAALTASRLALRDRLFQATIVQYERDLRPAGLRVLREQRAVREGATERAFVSLAADKLSTDGFVQADGDGGLVFYAPDAAVLTSSAFLRDHCFSITRDAREHAGEIGLAFAPVDGRRTADIRGALWLDSTSAELRLVEFRYVNVTEDIPDYDARGEVRFAHTGNGSWFVSRWFIRTPQYQVDRRPGRRPTTSLMQYREDGGDVTPTGSASVKRSATLTGRVMDSTGRAPLRHATVRLAGTPHVARAHEDGSFRLDSLAAGAFTLVVEHADYSALGMLASEQELELEEGSVSRTVVQALGSQIVLRRLCGHGDFLPDRAVVRIVLRDATTNTPLPGAEVRYQWNSFERRGTSDMVSVPNTIKATTDHDGAVMFCDVVTRAPVRFESRDPVTNQVAVQNTRFEPQTLYVVQLKR